MRATVNTNRFQVGCRAQTGNQIPNTDKQFIKVPGTRKVLGFVQISIVFLSRRVKW